jgi:type IV conjugative transfer system coupling protein TraD
VIASPSGKEMKITLGNFINHPKVQYTIRKTKDAFIMSVINSAFFAVGIVIVLCGLFLTKGKKQRNKRELRGAKLSSPQELCRELKIKEEASQFSLAGVPLKKDAEVQNTLITGTTGVGKTTALIELMDQARKQGQRAIVYDKKGTFVSAFYRPDKDIILNPLDARSPAWNVWAECHDGADFETLAQALMPEHLAQSDPFWTNAARTIFSAAAQQLRKKGECKMRSLLEPIFTDPESAEGLSTLLKGTIAETLVSEKIDKTALSIKATLSTYCKSLMFLNGMDENTTKIFSIRDWVQQEKQDSWLFFSVVDSLKMPLLRPLISVWLDVGARSLLTLPLNRERRIWTFYDELGSAHKLPSIEMTLAEGREYGICNVVSFLDKAQMYEKYGRNVTDAMLSLFNTNVFFRTNSEETAKWMSGLLGKHEVIEKRESLSMGASEMRDGVSLNEERRVEPLIMDTEFTTLPDLKAYLRLPGNYPRVLLNFPPRTDLGSGVALIRRKDLDLCEIQNKITLHETALALAIQKAEEVDNKKGKTKKPATNANESVNDHLELNRIETNKTEHSKIPKKEAMIVEV